MLDFSTNDFLFLLSQNTGSAHFEAYTDLLKRLGSPQQKCKCIHLAGTNGKGSTASFIASILSEANYRVGLYTSPDLYTVRERIRLNGVLISKADFERYITLIKLTLEQMQQEGFCLPTYFEVLTAIAFLYFYESKCDIVVLETGLGGKHDATNVIHNSLCSVITTISHDHIPRLGTTLEEIAYEKAGIIKPNAPVVSMPHTPSVNEIFLKVSKEQVAPLVWCDFSKLVPIGHSFEGQVFNYKDYASLNIQLLGAHQLYNAALAIDVIDVLRGKGLTISDAALYDGLKNATWQGRLEIICRHPLCLIDGAHNVEAAEALRKALIEYFPNKKIIYLFGCLRDKDYTQILEITMPLAYEVILTLPPSPRDMPVEALSKLITPYCPRIKTSSSIEEGVQLAFRAAHKHEEEAIIVAFGSLYFIGQLPSLMPNK